MTLTDRVWVILREIPVFLALSETGAVRRVEVFTAIAVSFNFAIKIFTRLNVTVIQGVVYSNIGIQFVLQRI